MKKLIILLLLFILIGLFSENIYINWEEQIDKLINPELIYHEKPIERLRTDATSIRVLISDINLSHANLCRNKVLLECPTAEVIIRIENLYYSIAWAKDNNIQIISRSTTGMSDYRNEHEGTDADNAGIGVVHAHGSNDHKLLTQPSYIGIIAVIGGGNETSNLASYGQGLEIWHKLEHYQSYSTARTAGMIAQLMINTKLDFVDCRKKIREYASYYPNHVEDGGYGGIKDLPVIKTKLDPRILPDAFNPLKMPK